MSDQFHHLYQRRLLLYNDGVAKWEFTEQTLVESALRQEKALFCQLDLQGEQTLGLEPMSVGV